MGIFKFCKMVFEGLTVAKVFAVFIISDYDK